MKLKRILGLLLAVLMLTVCINFTTNAADLLVTSTAPSKIVYVSDEGTEVGNGLTPDAPFNTYQKALEAVKDGGIVVLVGDTTFVGNSDTIITGTVVVTAVLAGENTGATLIHSGYNSYAEGSTGWIKFENIKMIQTTNWTPTYFYNLNVEIGEGVTGPNSPGTNSPYFILGGDGSGNSNIGGKMIVRSGNNFRTIGLACGRHPKEINDIKVEYYGGQVKFNYGFSSAATLEQSPNKVGNVNFLIEAQPQNTENFIQATEITEISGAIQIIMNNNVDAGYDLLNEVPAAGGKFVIMSGEGGRADFIETDTNAYKTGKYKITTDRDFIVLDNKAIENDGENEPRKIEYATLLDEGDGKLLSLEAGIYDVTYINDFKSYTFNNENGENAQNVIVEWSENNLSGHVETPKRTGYVFNGWYTQADGKGTKIDLKNISAAGTTVFYASWTQFAKNSPADYSMDFSTTEAVLELAEDNTAGGVEEAIEEYAETRRQQIRSTATSVQISGTSYYVSNDGNDSNNGLTPETAWKTLEKVSNAELQAGDGVFFRRGDTFRGQILTTDGVTYSAYGEGAKPNIYGSRRNYSEDGDFWIKTQYKNVYVSREAFNKDVGLIVFNEGEAVTIHRNPGINLYFLNESYLANDLEMYHKIDGTKDNGTAAGASSSYDHKIYLYSVSDPNTRFTSTEICFDECIITSEIPGGGNNVTVDNLCIKYTGLSGVSFTYGVTGVTVQNCEVGWCGGSIQNTTSRVVRLGNGVDSYGSVSNFTVENCYIYQIYDSGITHQYFGPETAANSTKAQMENIKYIDNLIEYCTWNIEIINTASARTGWMNDIEISGNLLLHPGEGWGKQRSWKNPVSLMHRAGGINYSNNYYIFDNVIHSRANVNGTHEGEYGSLIECGAEKFEYMPRIIGNLFIGLENGNFANYGILGNEKLIYTPEQVNNTVGFEDNTFYYANKNAVKNYTITWVIDGKVETQRYAYGATPTHAVPTKAGNAQYTYTFTGWTPEIKAVTGNATYTAQFLPIANTFTVTFTVNGEIYTTRTVNYGGTVTAPNYEVPEGYNFVTWQIPSSITSNITLNATLTQTGNIVVPDNNTPNIKPDDSKPDNSKPDDSKIDDGKTDSDKPDDSKPDDTEPYKVVMESVNVYKNQHNISFNDKTIARKNDGYILANGTEVPFSINYEGTNYLPARKLSEILGITIEYDEATRTVLVDTKTENTTDPLDGIVKDSKNSGAAKVSVAKNSVIIKVDGEKVVAQDENFKTQSDTEVPCSLIYEGTTYLPVRKLSELLGIGIDYDSEAGTVLIEKR